MNQIANSIRFAPLASPKAGRDKGSVMEPGFFSCVQGSLPGQDSATGFPVRSHHLSGLSITSALTHRWRIREGMDSG